MLGAVSHAQSPKPNTTIQFRASHPAPVSRFVAGRYYIYLPSIAILKKNSKCATRGPVFEHQPKQLWGSVSAGAIFVIYGS